MKRVDDGPRGQRIRNDDEFNDAIESLVAKGVLERIIVDGHPHVRLTHVGYLVVQLQETQGKSVN